GGVAWAAAARSGSAASRSERRTFIGATGVARGGHRGTPARGLSLRLVRRGYASGEAPDVALARRRAVAARLPGRGGLRLWRRLHVARQRAQRQRLGLHQRTELGARARIGHSAERLVDAGKAAQRGGFAQRRVECAVAQTMHLLHDVQAKQTRHGGEPAAVVVAL